MATAEQAVQIPRETRAGAVFRYCREIGSSLPVEQSEFLQFLSAQVAQPAFGGIEKLLQAPPMCFAFIQPAI